MVPTEADLIQMTGASVATEATDTLQEKEGNPEQVVTEAPAPAATEAAVKETEEPIAHTKVPVEETETPSVHTEPQTGQTESPLVHTDAPAEETEAPVRVTEATTENTEAAEVEDTAATEGTPEVTEAAGKAEVPGTDLLDKAEEPVSETDAGHVYDTERDEVELEDSDGEIHGPTFGRYYYPEPHYKCIWSPIHILELVIKFTTLSFFLCVVMSTGHVVGIVFGALVAVAIIIAVIVVVVRRMGQYS